MTEPDTCGSAVLFTVTWTAPRGLVPILVTNLVVGTELSHPQAPATGNEAALLVWRVSVTLVRQADAAKITSDILARTV